MDDNNNCQLNDHSPRPSKSQPLFTMAIESLFHVTLIECASVMDTWAILTRRHWSNGHFPQHSSEHILFQIPNQLDPFRITINGGFREYSWVGPFWTGCAHHSDSADIIIWVTDSILDLCHSEWHPRIWGYPPSNTLFNRRVSHKSKDSSLWSH